MLNEIIMKVILTIVGFLITGLLGYLSARVKGFKQKDKVQEEALKCLLRSAITSKYYVYSEMGVIPVYEKENLTYMFEQYKLMGGNSYINNLMQEINDLPIKK